MIAAWMALVLVVAVLLAVGALAADGAVRRAGGPARWVWLAGLAGCVALAFAAPARVVRGGAPGLAAATSPAAVSGPTATSAAGAGSVLDALSGPLARGIALTTRDVPASLGRSLLVGWLLLTLATMLAFTLAYARLLRARRGWWAGEVSGARVHVAADCGPAVLGLRRASIVVPAWLLDRAGAEQALVVAHEAEHMRAGDQWVLAVGCLATTLVPWHPAMWWMLSRLRLAVELDCDRRVLARGASPRAYGSLLIALAARGSGFGVSAPALAAGASHLERRLVAMTSTGTVAGRRGARFLAALLGLIALGTLVAACDARLPTSAEIQRMDVAGAARAAGLPLSDSAAYYVDGQRVTLERARAIPAARIARIQVFRGAMASDAAAAEEISITTMPENGALSMQPGVTVRARGLTDSPDRLTTRGPAPQVLTHGFAGLLFIDGKRADPAVVRTLSPNRIDRIEVLKGAAAVRLYGDTAAAHGVIRITTLR